MPSSTAEFEAHLDQTGLDRTLLIRHYARIIVAIAGWLSVLVLCFAHAKSREVSGLTRDLLLMFSNFSIAFSVLGMLFSQRMGKSLRRRASDVGERAGQIARYLTGRGRLFFCMAGFGQAVFVAGVTFGVDAFSRGGWFLLMNLIPTVMMVMIEAVEVPTRSRLVGLYRAVALLQKQNRPT